jgi:hypothetical protein
MRRLTKHWSRLAIASSGVDGLVGCERLNAVVGRLITSPLADSWLRIVVAGGRTVGPQATSATPVAIVCPTRAALVTSQSAVRLPCRRFLGAFHRECIAAKTGGDCRR